MVRACACSPNGSNGVVPVAVDGRRSGDDLVGAGLSAAGAKAVPGASAARADRDRSAAVLLLLRFDEAFEARRGCHRDARGRSSPVEGDPDGPRALLLPTMRGDCAAACTVSYHAARLRWPEPSGDDPVREVRPASAAEPAKRARMFRAVIAVRSRFRCPNGTPSSSKSASVSSGRTSASISLSRKVVSYWPSPRPRSQSPTSIVVFPLALDA